MSYEVLGPPECDQAWDKFYAQFGFRPDYYERDAPAIREPHPSLVYKFAQGRSESDLDELEEFFRRAFAALTPPGRIMYALDWQHECYKFSPHEDWSDLPIGIFPNGDYYIFFDEALAYGTFGHPWQSSLCVFGEPLVRAVQLNRPRILATLIRAST
jgi:hypothetical protein